MPVAIDTTILIEAERAGSIGAILPLDENGPFYIPAFAATEFLIGTYPPVRDVLRYRALLIYRGEFQEMVDDFTESDAVEMAKLVAELARKGQQMKFFDAGIAASVIARGDKLMTTDSDFDRLGDSITLLKI